MNRMKFDQDAVDKAMADMNAETRSFVGVIRSKRQELEASLLRFTQERIDEFTKDTGVDVTGISMDIARVHTLQGAGRKSIMLDVSASLDI